MSLLSLKVALLNELLMIIKKLLMLNLFKNVVKLECNNMKGISAFIYHYIIFINKYIKVIIIKQIIIKKQKKSN